MSSSSITDDLNKKKHLETFSKKAKSLYEELIQDIQEGHTDNIDDRITKLSADELELLVKETQAYKALGPASTTKQVVASVSNLRERYLKKLTTTAMVSFLFQMQSEFTLDPEDLVDPPKEEDFLEAGPAPTIVQLGGEKVDKPELNYSKFYNEELSGYFYKKFPEKNKVTNFKAMEQELDDDDLVEVNTRTNKRIKAITEPEKQVNQSKYLAALEAAIDEQSKNERKSINRFLKWLFEFNPIDHVQEGLQANIHCDPERGDASEYEHIPPNDTHCRFNSYYDLNYEKLRRATLDIYNVKPDLEHAMIVYDVVESQKDVDNFIQKYGASSKYDIVSFPLNTWALMGPFKENRDRINYYNKNNEIIKTMLEQQEKDANLGEDLMKKRIKTKKVQSERVFGKDSPEFEKYRKMNPSDLETKYGISLEHIDDKTIKVKRSITVDTSTGKEVKLDDDGVPVDGLEVPVTSINAKTGKTSQSRFFTQSQK